MSKFFNTPDPAKQITEIINRIGKTTPIEMIIREAAINGHDANKRLSRETRGIVHFTRDWENPKKLAIINYNGEYFGEKNLQSFMTIAYSNNLDPEQTSENFGIGAKTSYLLHGAILYRTKKAGEELGIYFIIEKDPTTGNYGLRDIWCPYNEHWTNTPVCDRFSEYLTIDTEGTEMVLLGESEEQDTFIQLEKASSVSGNTEGTGWNIYNYISMRVFKDIGTDFKVSIYKSGTEEKMMNANTSPLSQYISRCERYGSFLLEGIGIPEGTIAHYGLKPQGTERQIFSSGFVSFGFKNENYLNQKLHHTVKAQQLINCGIHTKPTSWFVVFELPETEEINIEMHRKSLDGIEKELYYSAFAQNLPEEITDWLDNEIDAKDDTKKIDDWLKDRFKFKIEQNTCGEEKGDKVCNDSEKTIPLAPQEQQKTARILKFQKEKKSVLPSKKIQNFKIPNHRRVSHGEFLPLVQFNFDAYTITVNEDNPLWKHRVQQISKDFNTGIESIIETETYRRILDSAIGAIFEIQEVFPKETIQNKKDKWNPDILSSIWTKDQVNNSNRYLKKKYSNFVKK